MIPELICLALTVYHEARNEPFDGQVAVEQVVLNRVASDKYPDTICEVVEQGGPPGDSLPLHPLCQFSWRCDGLPDRPYNQRAWRRSKVIAQLVYSGVLRHEETADATHYHANYVGLPRTWRVAHLDQVGRHIFYKEGA